MRLCRRYWLHPDRNTHSCLIPLFSISQTSAAKSYASAGQFELMSLYQSLFSPKGVTASQMLLTQADFSDSSHLKNLTFAVERLLSLGIVPIINENDAVSVIPTNEVDNSPMFSDNDSLAALVARTFGAEVLLLLTDVDGVYDKPPTSPGARLIPYYHTDSKVAIGEKSSQGRGGMAAKIAAAQGAVMPGSSCTACVIAAGSDLDSVRTILGREYKPQYGPPKGTLFATPGSDLATQAVEESVVAIDVSTGIRGEREQHRLPIDETILTFGYNIFRMISGRFLLWRVCT